TPKPLPAETVPVRPLAQPTPPPLRSTPPPAQPVTTRPTSSKKQARAPLIAAPSADPDAIEKARAAMRQKLDAAIAQEPPGTVDLQTPRRSAITGFSSQASAPGRVAAPLSSRPGHARAVPC